MDLVAGFVHSQVLMALVELKVLDLLIDGPMRHDALALRIGMDPQRLDVLVRAGAALGLLKLRGSSCRLTRKGAALTGVPGLADMIRHHKVLYADLADPAAFFRDGGETALARFWPYVFGAGAAEDPDTAARYSALMADTQVMIAEETLAAISLTGRTRLLDVGGGTGAFLAAALQHTPGLQGVLFDLPAVVSQAQARFATHALENRVEIVPGSFCDDPLPGHADAISLVRVLYDHADDTVASLLSKVYGVLPSGGQLVVSEPMSGGRTPTRAGDAYFAVYTLAMGTGRTRSADEIGRLLENAGFTGVRAHKTRRPFITSVVSAAKA